jgi:hypothetical protein
MRTISAGTFSASICEDLQHLYIWGTSPYGEFLTPHHVKRITGEVCKVSIGNNFGVAITNNGTLYSWGEN